MTSCPEVMGWGSSWFWIKAGSWDLDLDEAGWFLGPVRGQTVYGLRGARTHWLSQWVESWRWTNSQHSKNCVSLSSCRKPKLKEGNKSFVPVPKESSVFRVFRIPMRMNFLWTLWTFNTSVYMHLNILAVCYTGYNLRTILFCNEMSSALSKRIKIC